MVDRLVQLEATLLTKMVPHYLPSKDDDQKPNFLYYQYPLVIVYYQKAVARATRYYMYLQVPQQYPNQLNEYYQSMGG